MTEQIKQQPIRKIKTLRDTDYLRPGTYKNQLVRYLYTVGLGTILTKTILAPLQRWRIISQTQTVYPFRPLKFKNFADYIKRIPTEQGISAFWRGNMSTIGIFFFQTFFQIGVYDSIKNEALLWSQQTNSAITQPPVYISRVVLPIIATFLTQIITFPMDTARIRITMNHTKDLRKSGFHSIRTCLKHLRAEQNGLKSMYKGFLLSNAISLININLYISLADALSNVNTQQLSDIQRFVNKDTVSATLAMALIHPLDTLKKIVQLNNISAPSIVSNVRSAWSYIQRQHSYKILYRGITVSIVKSLLFLPVFVGVQSALKQAKKQGRQYI